jgi:hypothetical protein
MAIPVPVRQIHTSANAPPQGVAFSPAGSPAVFDRGSALIDLPILGRYHPRRLGVLLAHGQSPISPIHVLGRVISNAGATTGRDR